MTSRNRRPLWTLLMLSLACSLPVQAKAASGAERYAHDCASCHGASGAGDGAQGRTLDPRPANLRGLAARNGGQFPSEKVRRIIDGRDHARGHGQGDDDSDMPVWGHEYNRALAGEGERMVQDNLDRLVEFLKTLQDQ